MMFEVKKLLKKIRDFLPLPVFFMDIRVMLKSNKASQILLILKYKQLMDQKLPLPKFDEVEFRAFSQNGEDGILLYIFSIIGTTNKKCVELCASDGLECNTANLIINHGWKALLIDGRRHKVIKGKRFYSRWADTYVWPPKLVHEWVTKDNVNEIIKNNDFEGDIDLLSLDMDGIDYWIWKALDCVNPKVVILEYNNLLGPNDSLTVPYKEDFAANIKGMNVSYFGASLKAFVKLAEQKGYRLVGCQRYGYNAFFVRSGIAENVFPKINPAECFNHPFTQHAMKVRRKLVLDKEWVKV